MGNSSNLTSKSKIKYRELFISEHVIVLPFEIDKIIFFKMLPAIFHRSNYLLKSNKLRKLIEKQIKIDLNIDKV